MPKKLMRTANLLPLLLVFVVPVAFIIYFSTESSSLANPSNEDVINDVNDVDDLIYNYQRIISLAPSITESLYALGLGEKVVGVTKYCKYPPEAALNTIVGGYLDPNYEAIVSLSPDLVVLFPENLKSQRLIDSLNIESITVKHASMEDILQSILQIGEKVGATENAIVIVSDIRQRIAYVKAKTQGLERPSVLVSIGKNINGNTINSAYISGKGSFYHEMLEMAGGSNVYLGEIEFPSLSNEGLIRLNPKIIIDIVPELKQSSLTEDEIVRQWLQVLHVDAVADKRIYVLGDEHVAIPGPRFILVLEAIAEILHPEIDWNFPDRNKVLNNGNFKKD